MQPSKTSILYLEDEIIIALDTAQTLKDMGFRAVHVVHNLRRAASIAEEVDTTFECALLDVNISGEGLSLDFGRSLLRQGITVVFASGYNRHEMEIENAGLTFVEKPLNAPAILDAFQRAHSHLE